MPWPVAIDLGRVDRERALVDADDRGARLLRGFERPRPLPVREPEQQGDAQRPRERRRQDSVDGAHVGDDRDRLRPQLLRQRGLEAHTAPDLRARGEAPAAAVVRQRARQHAIGEHDHLVDELRKRADLRHRGRERRMRRIDLLRDEDQPPHQGLLFRLNTHRRRTTIDVRPNDKNGSCNAGTFGRYWATAHPRSGATGALR